jgi:hypothetical protein
MPASAPFYRVVFAQPRHPDFITIEEATLAVAREADDRHLTGEARKEFFDTTEVKQVASFPPGPGKHLSENISPVTNWRHFLKE